MNKLPTLISEEINMEVHIRVKKERCFTTRRSGESRQSVRNRRNPRMTIMVPYTKKVQFFEGQERQRQQQIERAALNLVKGVGRAYKRYKIKLYNRRIIHS